MYRATSKVEDLTIMERMEDLEVVCLQIQSNIITII